MYHLDPVVDAERAIKKMDAESEQAAADCRKREEQVSAAQATLAEIYGKAMKGPADFHVPTPGSGRKTRAVFELLGDLEDDQLAELFEILRDTANGQDVRGRATVFQASVSERHADWYASVKVIGEEAL